MIEVHKADALVNAAFRRVQGLDRISRSAPIGRAELGTIVLQALAELGAHADWTVTPGITNSILHLMDEAEQERYAQFEERVRQAVERIGAGDETPSSILTASGPVMMEIDPAPRSESRTVIFEDVLADEELARRAAEAIVYQLYFDIVDRAAILVERSPAARERLWPLVWVVAALIPPPDTSLRDQEVNTT